LTCPAASNFGGPEFEFLSDLCGGSLRALR
jgi:hypothetical protein